MIENKLRFFFKKQICHLAGRLLLFYIATQLIDLENNTNTLLGASAKNWFIFSIPNSCSFSNNEWFNFI